MARLFGTDGVRGIAGEQLDRDLAVALGRAAVRKIGKRIFIGRDSRESGPMLEQALVDGICAEGGQPAVVGIVPTPAIALITREMGADCGIVISASHNPPEYNGIKFFDGEGYKLPDEVEDEMQVLVEELRGEQVEAGQARPVPNAALYYANHAAAVLQDRGVDLSGMKIAVDCAHGASCETTPATLRALGAEVYVINADPDGSEINVGCGSTHLEPVKFLMESRGADIAIAHDGDADRMLALAPDGTVIDGDFLLAICAKDLKERGMLDNNLVVSTVMANLGFQLAMKREGIDVITTKVGDRYVLEAMREQGAVLGGEQSGHIIFGKRNTTGDGLVSALELLGVIAANGKSANELMGVMEKFPQALVNVRVTDRTLYEGNEAIAAAEAAAVEELGDEGRLLVRPSGTEPLIRVMVEAHTQEQADEIANRVADAVIEQIGA
ncbi:MAG: phosphoglucosamine mutase [Coriobacteriales bacterium]